MYGTVARMRVKAGMLDKLKDLMSTDDMKGIPGLVSSVVFRMDADANELYLAVAFESREAYTKNAESPEQHQRYLQMIELLDGDPEWHDGEVVYKAP